MAIGKITTDKTHRGHSMIAELLVAFICFIELSAIYVSLTCVMKKLTASCCIYFLHHGSCNSYSFCESFVMRY